MKKSSAKILVSNIIKSLLLPVIVYLIFVILTGGKFGTAATMVTMLRNACQSIILAWGTMLVVATGMWDFSAGAQLYLSALIAIPIITSLNMNPVGMILVLLVISLLMRVAVAVIYQVVHVKSMVTTLALAMIFESISKYVFGSGLTFQVKSCLAIANAPWCFVIVAVMAVFTIVIWKYTKFAYHVRALSTGENVARGIGLNPGRIRFFVFLVEGVFLALATALMLATRGFILPPTNLSSNTLVFNALMAVFIGQALERYSNRVIGVAIGTIVMTMLNSGLLAMGVNSAWQVTVTGVFMALFIGFSTNQQRVYQYFDDRRRAREISAKYGIAVKAEKR